MRLLSLALETFLKRICGLQLCCTECLASWGEACGVLEEPAGGGIQVWIWAFHFLLNNRKQGPEGLGICFLNSERVHLATLLKGSLSQLGLYG